MVTTEKTNYASLTDYDPEVTKEELVQEIGALLRQLDVYSILEVAYSNLEGMGKQWVDNNWKALCTTWSEHMLDPENWD